MKSLLPLGTIIRPKDETEEFMIIGYYPIDKNTNKLYDYITCLYPIGITNENHYLINNIDIASIHFYGEQTPELADIRKEIMEIKKLRLAGKPDEEIIKYLEKIRNENL